MGYLLYLIIYYSGIILVLSILSLYFSIKVLFNKRLLMKSSNLSFIMTLYFVYVFILGISCVVYFPYYFIFWSFEKVTYDARILFLLESVYFILINLSSVIGVLQCIDISLSITFSAQFTRRHRLLFLCMSIICIFAVILYFVYNLRVFYPETPVTECRFFACFLKSGSYLLCFKGVAIILNLAGSIIFAVLFKKFITTSTPITERIYKVTLILILATTFIEFIPFVISQLFYFVSSIKFW